ncbi:MAG TPA: threonine/serine dehydratase [Micropepsaceae bacterium]|nr:threonine/serine dehydratase [Micropepsaceae bacterium]
MANFEITTLGYNAPMSDGPQSIPSFDDVKAAAERLTGVAAATPFVESLVLSERVGGRVFLKLETLQRTGSFKFRGAYNRLVQLSPAKRHLGVVAFSSGNHAQGVAAAAALLGIPATIVMPADAPRIKTESTRALGAVVVPYDRKREKREAIADRIAAEKGAVVVPSFDDSNIVAGQGTVGLEIAGQAAALGVALEAVLVPCSGGGLSSGVALALRAASPGTRVFTAEPEGYDGTRLSLETGGRIAAAGTRDTIADALTSPAPGMIPFAILKACGAGGVAVDDAALMAAVGFAAMKLKLVVEPGGAAALAAVLSGAFDARGKTIGIVLSGGNIDPDMLRRCLDATA